MASFGERMAGAIEQAGVKVASSVPDNWLAPVIERLSASTRVAHAPAAREEDAVGICFGAALAGVRAVALMQNSGALNTGNTLATLGVAYGVPAVLIVCDRGHLGDVTIAHIEKARTFRPFLNALKLSYYELSPDFDVRDEINAAFQMAELSQRPVVLLLTKSTVEVPS
jgi:sulfopyruvate decarboxylase subunit alpha